MSGKQNNHLPKLPFIEIPAWGSPSEWEEANQSLTYLLEIYKKDLFWAVDLAREIQDNFEKIFPVQDELCRETCPHCPDPCCLNATVWVDLKDLLFFHLTNQKIPEKQLIEIPHDLCLYHSSTGCKLPRLSRPFTCTLYLCPSQMTKFRLLNSDVRKDYEKRVNSIKQSRRFLEDMFVRLGRA